MKAFSITIHLRLALLLIMLSIAWVAPRAEATGRLAEAVVVASVGSPTARLPSGSIHHGRSDTVRLMSGVSVGELASIQTGRDGQLCLVLSPGVLVHVRPNTEFTIQQMRHSASGLPRTEDDLVRRIILSLDKGELYVHAGSPSPTLDMKVKTESGTITAQGGVFRVIQDVDQKVWFIDVEEHQVSVNSPRVVVLQAGEVARWTASDGAQLAMDSGVQDRRPQLCEGYFRDMEAFWHPVLGFDRGGLANYLGVQGAVLYLGPDAQVADVSPAVVQPPVSPPISVPAALASTPDGRRWEKERIWSWWRDQGPVIGVNYIPRNCVNSIEMWMADTFDETIIDEELGWAASIGYTAVRIPLQYAVWAVDRDGFLDRVDRFLELASGHGLKVVPVLFDDLNRAGREPVAEPQPDPADGVHNPQWVPSPGSGWVTRMETWGELEAYVRGVMGRFRRDARVFYWDLYNTAGNDGLWDQSLPLMDQVFNWARDINPQQPLAVAAWTDLGRPMSARKLERSDMITFQSFEDPAVVEGILKLLQRYQRPIIASDWLMRQKNNRFDTLLPVFSQYQVGWFNRGLVQGRTQTWIQDPVFASPDHPDVWQHDVLDSEGKPYDEREIEWIRGFRFGGAD
ncbi:MAG TPA: FecR family protein [Kiritimatiellia bacterium]|nr:FecR family protein [Kiritimatiellia bacterium]